MTVRNDHDLAIFNREANGSTIRVDTWATGLIQRSLD